MKATIKNISFAEYIELKDKSEYDFILRHSGLLKTPLDLFGLGDLVDYTFGQVKDIQEVANVEGLKWDSFFAFITEVKGLSDKQQATRPLFDLQRARVYLIQQVEQINKLESTALGNTPDGNEIAAGVEKFAEYRAFLQYDTLTNGDVTKIDEVKKQPYLNCFLKLKLNADRAAYSERLNNILKRK